MEHARARDEAERERLRRRGSVREQRPHTRPVAVHRLAVPRARPLGGAAVPVGGGQCLPRALPVMREQRRLLVELLGGGRLDRARDGGVDLPPALAEL